MAVVNITPLGDVKKVDKKPTLLQRFKSFGFDYTFFGKERHFPLWAVIVLVCVIDPLGADILPVLTVSRHADLLFMIGRRIVICGMLLTVFIGMCLLKKKYKDVVEGLTVFLKKAGSNVGEMKEAIGRQGDRTLLLECMLLFWGIYFFVILNDVLNMMDNRELLGWPYSAGGDTSNGVVVLVFLTLLWMVFYAPFLGLSLYAVILIIDLAWRVSPGIDDETIDLLEPHKCGGLHPIGDLHFYMITPFFIALSIASVLAWIDRQFTADFRWGSVLFYASLWGLCVVSIMAPQLHLSFRMSEVKTAWMQNIAGQIKKLERTKPVDIQEEIRNQQARALLLVEYNQIHDLREYPINRPKIKSMLLLIALPIVTNIMNILIVRNLHFV